MTASRGDADAWYEANREVLRLDLLHPRALVRLAFEAARAHPTPSGGCGLCHGTREVYDMGKPSRCPACSPAAAGGIMHATHCDHGKPIDDDCAECDKAASGDLSKTMTRDDLIKLVRNTDTGDGTTVSHHVGFCIIDIIVDALLAAIERQRAGDRRELERMTSMYEDACNDRTANGAEAARLERELAEARQWERTNKAGWDSSLEREKELRGEITTLLASRPEEVAYRTDDACIELHVDGDLVKVPEGSAVIIRRVVEGACPNGDACPDARRYGEVHPAPVAGVEDAIHALVDAAHEYRDRDKGELAVAYSALTAAIERQRAGDREEIDRTQRRLAFEITHRQAVCESLGIPKSSTHSTVVVEALYHHQEIARLEGELAEARAARDEALRSVDRWQGNLEVTLKEGADKIRALKAFKDFVHGRLDEAGIPTHPDGPHSKEGCRIGDRLDIALASREFQEKALRFEKARAAKKERG